MGPWAGVLAAGAAGYAIGTLIETGFEAATGGRMPADYIYDWGIQLGLWHLNYAQKPT
jgi:hypothetical protein